MLHFTSKAIPNPTNKKNTSTETNEANSFQVDTIERDASSNNEILMINVLNFFEALNWIEIVIR